MHILFIAKSVGTIGGEEIVTILKANALAAIPGNQVTIACLYMGGYPEHCPRPVSPAVSVIPIGENFDGLPASPLKMALAYVSRLWRIRRNLVRIIGQLQPDVIVNAGRLLRFSVSPISVSRRQVKVHELHLASNWRQHMGSHHLRRLQNFIDFKILARGFDALFLLTQADKRAHFPRNPRYRVMPNPLTIPYEPEKNDDARRQKIVLSAGRLATEKNFPGLIRAWAQVAPQAPGWKLRILGQGSEKQHILAEAQRLGVADSVELPGPSTQVASEMRQASIFALASHVEGWALVLTEAAACGLPLVSYDTPYGPSDIITDGHNGILVTYDDEPAMAAALLRLIRNKDERQAMGRQASIMAQQYLPATIARRWMQEYTALLEKKSSKSTVRI